MVNSLSPPLVTRSHEREFVDPSLFPHTLALSRSPVAANVILERVQAAINSLSPVLRTPSPPLGEKGWGEGDFLPF